VRCRASSCACRIRCTVQLANSLAGVCRLAGAMISAFDAKHGLAQLKEFTEPTSDDHFAYARGVSAQLTAFLQKFHSIGANGRFIKLLKNIKM
jgi:hypothetical protein